jgi:hypothetical protein
LVGSIVVFCALYGFSFALLAPNLILPLLFPIVFLLTLVVWVLPATQTAPTALLEALFLLFFVGLVVWPNYLAVTVPGLPWITISRLTGPPLAFILLVCVSVSREFRMKLGTALNASQILWKVLVLFVGLQLVSIGLSRNLPQSINKFVDTQINWTMIFFASSYIFLKPGRAVVWSSLIWLMAVVVAAIGLWESSVRHVLWVGHIPWILNIDDETVRRILSGHEREYTGKYRTQSTFSTSLGLAEYIALAMPFVLYFLSENYRWYFRIAAAITVPFLIYVVLLTDARLGLIGCLLAMLGYGLAWPLFRWRRTRDSIVGPAIVLAYPLIFSAAIAATLFVGRIRGLVWGSSATAQGSSQARVDQYNLGLPKIVTHPWGYGAGMGGDALGYRTPGGFLTIDSYFLSIALEYGVVGFILYYGMIALSVYAAGRGLLLKRSVEREMALLVPVTLSLLNFVVIKSVFSQDQNHPLVFMMMGMVVALVYRRNKAAPSTSGAGP